ncbi:lipid A export permease/ATP-binding protein MsbA [Pseudoxanthomonas sp. CAU 1598]|uniref:Lipid A export permease/ATP-binding protein MsbA n=2 Tax=Pseudomarimonas arenosa TaxID=2774145 RepID=A0AAW3ZJ79_9GAMM|nr:lipid A export permease/ATP-binding protein MsbA [Pseudomarimonas arenosa]MBD8525279.1 lipid A export permease/ATP-binding protein MsbA [Pseudomarimonas arenosa]
MDSGDALPPAWPSYKRLLGYAFRYRTLLLAALVGMVLDAACGASFIKLMEPLINEAFVAKNPDAGIILPLIIVGLFLLRGAATFATDYGMARAGRSVVRDLRQALMAKYLRLRGERFDAEPVQVMVSRLNFDTEQVAQASSDALKVVVTDSLYIIALIAVMLSQSVKVTVTMFVAAPVIALIVSTVGKRYRRLNREIQSGVGTMAHRAEQTLYAQQEVKLYGAQASELKRYGEQADRLLGLNTRVEATRAMSSSTVQLLAAMALAVIVYVASGEAQAGRVNAGQFVSLMTAMMALLPSLKRITTVQSQLSRGVTAAQRIFAVLDLEEEQEGSGHPLIRAKGELRFERVGVRYASQEGDALSEVSFVARPGTVTAIVGRSGSGKTTLVRLIPRFYEPSAGRILLDGQPLENYALADLRRQIAMVGQQVILFDDSVASNIGFGRPEADPAALRKAADIANASEFIDELPNGMQAEIGDKGSRLSGGQRQRLAIARAVLKDAPILILDEATAALDSRSERLVQAALDRLIPDRTTLIIAHRLSTVEHADQVLVLDQGRLVEQGTHTELLSRGGLYAQLHRLQFRDPAASEGQ